MTATPLYIQGVASSEHVRGPQLDNIMLTIANVNQDIDTILKQDKREGGHGPPWPHCSNTSGCCNHMVTSNPERDVFAANYVHCTLFLNAAPLIGIYTLVSMYRRAIKFTHTFQE